MLAEDAIKAAIADYRAKQAARAKLDILVNILITQCKVQLRSDRVDQWTTSQEQNSRQFLMDYN